MVCDSEGNVVLCSDAPSGCEHQGLQLNQAYLQKVIRSGGDTATGVINGLYSDRRYMVSRPILVDGNAGGIVLVSTPANDITQIMNKISNIFLTAALFVVLISVLAVTAFARRESRPLKELAKTANAFGHGDLEAGYGWTTITPRKWRKWPSPSITWQPPCKRASTGVRNSLPTSPTS